MHKSDLYGLVTNELVSVTNVDYETFVKSNLSHTFNRGAVCGGASAGFLVHTSDLYGLVTSTGAGAGGSMEMWDEVFFTPCRMTGVTLRIV